MRIVSSMPIGRWTGPSVASRTDRRGQPGGSGRLLMISRASSAWWRSGGSPACSSVRCASFVARKPVNVLNRPMPTTSRTEPTNRPYDRHRVAIAIADGRDRHERVPEGVTAGLDIGRRVGALGDEHEDGADLEHDDRQQEDAEDRTAGPILKQELPDPATAQLPERAESLDHSGMRKSRKPITGTLPIRSSQPQRIM